MTDALMTSPNPTPPRLDAEESRVSIRVARERVFLNMSPERRVLAIQGLEQLAAKHPNSGGIAEALAQARDLQVRELARKEKAPASP